MRKKILRKLNILSATPSPPILNGLTPEKSKEIANRFNKRNAQVVKNKQASPTIKKIMKVNNKKGGVRKIGKPPLPGKVVGLLKEFSEKIFISGGIGDIFAIEAFFSDKQRKNLQTVVYGSKKSSVISDLFRNLPNYSIQKHIEEWTDFSKFWCFLSKKQCETYVKKPSKDFQESEDFSIARIFSKINKSQWQYNYSSWLIYKLASIEKFNLPDFYVTICPYSTDKGNPHRDFNEKDWEVVLNYLEKENLKGVVVNKGTDTVPDHPNLIDLNNLTTMAEAIEILKNSKGYLGIDTCFSVLAAKLFSADSLMIKIINNHGLNYKNIYFAPHMTFDFLFSKANTNNLKIIRTAKTPASEITLVVPQGLGDIFWVYQKFAPYYNKINIDIAVIGEDKVQNRSEPWLSLFPKIDRIGFKKMTAKMYEAMIAKYYKIENILNREINDSVEYSCNKWLESGVRIDEIDSSLKIEEFIDLKVEPFDLPFNKYVCLYVSGSTKMHGAAVLGAWPIEGWLKLTREVYKTFGTNLPIVIIGASFDANVIREISEKLTGAGIQNHHFINEAPAKILHVLKNCEFFIGYQSGLNIVADNFDVKQIMIYYKYLEPMLYTWAKRKNIANGTFNAFTFSDSIERITYSLPNNFYTEGK